MSGRVLSNDNFYFKSLVAKPDDFWLVFSQIITIIGKFEEVYMYCVFVYLGGIHWAGVIWPTAACRGPICK